MLVGLLFLCLGHSITLVSNNLFLFVFHTQHTQKKSNAIKTKIEGYVIVLSAAKSLADSFDDSNLIGVESWALIGIGFFAKCLSKLNFYRFLFFVAFSVLFPFF